MNAVRHTINKWAILGLATMTASICMTLAGCGTASAAGGEVPGEVTQADTGDIRTWKAIEESGTVRVGTEGTRSPYSYHDFNGQMAGYDIELIEAVAGKLNLNVTFVEMEPDELATGLEAGRCDVVTSQIETPTAIKQKYVFSAPYAYVTGAVITHESTEDIDSFGDLDGRRVALATTSNWAELAKSYGAEIVPAKDLSEVMQMVIDGRADATVSDSLAVQDYMEQHPLAPVRIAVESDKADGLALMTVDGQDELKNQIDLALRELREDGTLASISKRYFNNDISLPQE